MTLVVAIADKRLRMFMLTGDIMLSSDLPASSTQRSNTINPPDTSRASYTLRGYTQKLVHLSDNIYLAWTGKLTDAQRLIRRARSEIQGSGKELRPRELSNELLRFICREKIALQFALASFSHGRMRLFGGRWNMRTKVGPTGVGLAFGSGSKDFEKFLAGFGDITKRYGSTAWFAGQGYVALLMDFMAQALSKTPVRNQGLNSRWGLGMELLVFWNGKGPAKLDRVLYQTFSVDRSGDKPKLEQFEDTTFCYYDEDDLIVLTRAQDGSSKRPFLVPPPDKMERSSRRSWKYRDPPSSPCAVFTILVEKAPPNRHTKAICQYDPNGVSGINISRCDDEIAITRSATYEQEFVTFCLALVAPKA